MEDALRNCGWWAGVELLTVRFGVDLFLSSLGVEAGSLRNEATEGDLEILVLPGVDERPRGVLSGVRDGEGSSREVDWRVLVLFALLGTFLSVSCSFTPVLCGVRWVICSWSFVSIDGTTISGSRSILGDGKARLCLLEMKSLRARIVSLGSVNMPLDMEQRENNK